MPVSLLIELADELFHKGRQHSEKLWPSGNYRAKCERCCESIEQPILRGALKNVSGRTKARGHVTLSAWSLTSRGSPLNHPLRSGEALAPTSPGGRAGERWPCACPSYTPYNNVGCWLAAFPGGRPAHFYHQRQPAPRFAGRPAGRPTIFMRQRMRHGRRKNQRHFLLTARVHVTAYGVPDSPFMYTSSSFSYRGRGILRALFPVCVRVQRGCRCWELKFIYGFYDKSRKKFIKNQCAFP